MGLDINLFRTDKGGNPDAVRESLRRRFKDVKIVDEIIAKDEEWRKSRYQLDNLNKEYNKAIPYFKKIRMYEEVKECYIELKK